MNKFSLKISQLLSPLLQTSGTAGALFFVLLGAIASLTFAPTSYFLLVFIIFPMLVKALDFAEDKQRAFFVGGWFGFGLFSAGLYWVGHSFLSQTQFPQWAAPFAVVALAGALAVFIGLSFALAKRFWTNSPVRIVVFSLSWVLFEWLRGHMFTGFPWHQVSHIWVEVPVVMQSLSLFGSYGLSLVTVFVAASPVLLLSPPNKTKPYFAIALIVTSLVVVSFGSLRLSQSELSFYPDVRLRLVQANIKQIEKWPREFWSRNVSRYINLSIADEGNKPTHVIWPETAVPYYLHTQRDIRATIINWLGGDVHLITGVPRIDRQQIKDPSANTADTSAPEKIDGNGIKLYNSVVAIAPNAEILSSYDKHHLVPFGEYVPLWGLLKLVGIDKMVAGDVGFTPGPGTQTMNVSGLPSFSPLICYEIIFPARVRANSNAKWLLNLTNDAWFGESFGPHQHFAQARFRAVEEGVAVVRVAATGISGVVDPWGRVVNSLDIGVQGVIDSNLPKPIASQTLFSKFGNVIFYLMFFITSALALCLLKREKN